MVSFETERKIKQQARALVEKTLKSFCDKQGGVELDYFLSYIEHTKSYSKDFIRNIIHDLVILGIIRNENGMLKWLSSEKTIMKAEEEANTILGKQEKKAR